QLSRRPADRRRAARKGAGGPHAGGAEPQCCLSAPPASCRQGAGADRPPRGLVRAEPGALIGSMLKRLLAAAALFLSLAGVALAHPHIFIDARAALEFDAAGRLTTIRNSWTFDEA